MTLEVLTIVFLCTVFAIWLLRRGAGTFGLLAVPGGRREHEGITPLVGGIGIFMGLLAGFAYLYWKGLFAQVNLEFSAVFWAMLGLVILGVMDDRVEMRARTKFAFEALIATLAVLVADLHLVSLGQVLPGLDMQLGAFAPFVTVLAVLSMINAVNMIDGSDGLAGTQLVVSFAGLAAACLYAGSSAVGVLMLFPCSAIVGFLVFNLRLSSHGRAKAFLGDAGTMMLGFLLAVMAIIATTGNNGVPPAVVLWICALPLLDGLTTIMRRSRAGKAISIGYRDHLHHLLRARGASVNDVVFWEGILAVAGVVFALTIWQLGLPEWVLTVAFVLAAVLYRHFVDAAWRHLGTGDGFAPLSGESDPVHD
jgi:UDP-GlcNAc:undecaprenyl-phosphate GlcNAc-1-phosphate transferase